MRNTRKILIFLLFSVLLTATADPLNCKVCGRRIAGSYLSDGKSVYCGESCYETTLPKCSVCKKTIRTRTFLSNGKQVFCSRTCRLSTLPKCSVCRQPLEGKYTVLTDESGIQTRYCKTCAVLPRCFSCGLPGARSRLSDGRAMCSRCSVDTIDSEARAYPLFLQVKSAVEHLLGVRIDCPVKLRLVGLPALERISGNHAEDNTAELGFCHTRMTEIVSLGKRRISQYECKIYILSHLPQKSFVEVAAHELAHHWQNHRFPYLRKTPLSVSEGFAEYVASRVNLLLGQPERNLKKERRGDPVYGEGYRMFLRISAGGGTPAVLNFLKKNSRKPALR